MSKCAVIIENRFDVGEIIARHTKFLSEDWPVIHIKAQINTIQDYNDLLVSKNFWEALPDKVLIFQHDSGLLRHGVEDFLEWDFIGAPIKWLPTYMNGGLSLRSRAAMLRVIEEIPYNGEVEDIWFVNGCRKLGLKLPDIDTARKFSVETEFNLGSIGYHAPEKYLTPKQVELIKYQYD